MEEAKKENAVDQGEELQWYFRPWVITGAIFLFGPLGLIPLWFRPETKMYLKIFISVLVFAGTIWMTVEATKYYQKLLLHYRELAEVAASM